MQANIYKRADREQRFLASSLLALAISVLLFMPTLAGAYSGSVAGWIPWWRAEAGIKSAEAELEVLDTIYPFVYEVTAAGELTAKSDLAEAKWQNLQRAAPRQAAIIPTVAWFDGEAIDEVLSDKKLRQQHIDKIVAMVRSADVDGVNIDYEQKLAKTKDDFSVFLAELKKALGKKLLTCTVEARTPADSRFRVVPSDLEYANDYQAMAKHCDRIELMTYDQQRADWQLNEARSGLPYMPVADKAWVEKVLQLALQDIPADKLILGIPTYGRVWDVKVAPNWFRDYQAVATLNVPRLREMSGEVGVLRGRDPASGEMRYSYFPDDSPYALLRSLPVPAGTPKGMEAAAQALLFANMSGMEVTVRFVTYSDAVAMQDKIKLADQYDLAGIALFKIDGEEDSKIWKLLRQ